MPARRSLALLVAALTALALTAMPASASAETRVKAKTAAGSQTNAAKPSVCWALVVGSGGRVGMGLFITRDPIGHASGETNLYRYAAGDPANLTDPTGLCLIPIACGAQEAVVDAGQAAGEFVYEHSTEISAGAGTLALAPTPLSPFLGGIAIATGGLSAHKSISDGDYVGAAMDVGAIAFGGASVFRSFRANSREADWLRLRGALPEAASRAGLSRYHELLADQKPFAF